MPIMFNSILSEAGFDINEVRLLRHKDARAEKGRTPYELWRDNRSVFDLYQSIQGLVHESKLRVPYWASFIGTPNDETLFVGIYSVTGFHLLDHDIPMPQMEGVIKAGSCNIYNLVLEAKLNDLIGKLLIDWGLGDRAWIQRADRQNKQVVELRPSFKEPDFPGFLNFIVALSKINSLPNSWITALKSSRGIYLLTFPKTKEHYVGSATGENGFWGRWQDYVNSGHGGNIEIKNRDLNDFQISILEVAGTSATQEDIIKMEVLWKLKLQSREMGLNKN